MLGELPLRRCTIWLLLAALASLAFILLPQGGVAAAWLFEAFAALAVVGIFVGVRLGRPAAPLGWWALAAGQATNAVAYLVWYPLPLTFGYSLPSPSLADALFLAGYAAMLAGMLILTQAREARGDRTGLIDAAFVAVGIGTLAWIAIVEPNLRDSSQVLFDRLVDASYSLVDVILVGLAGRLLMSPGIALNRAQLCLTGWAVSQLAGDTVYAVQQMQGGFRLGAPVFILWLLSFGFLGAAALNGSMSRLTQRPEKPPAPLRRRLLGLAVVSLIAPAILAWQSLHGERADLVVVVASMALFLLVLLRLADLMVDVGEHARVRSALEKSREELREAAGMLRGILNSDSAVIHVRDLDGRYLLVNRAWAGKMGLQPGDVVGHHMSEFFPADQVREALGQDREAVRLGRGLLIPERRKSYTDGTEHWVDVSLMPFRLADGRAAVLSVVQDVTNRVEARQAIQANEAKSRFLAGMSHELRTPLNSILGFAQLLETESFGPLTDRQRRYVSNIQGSGRHLLALVTDILDLAKVEAGEMEIRPEPLDARAEVDEVVQQVIELAAEKGLRLEVQGSAAGVLADRRRLRQVLLNLLSNAIKFTEPGGRIDVLIGCAAGQISLAVRDSGIGIAAADHERVFDEFTQLDAANTRHQPGTGLGLALTRQLVHAMGGEIRLLSQPGQGSTFTVLLPAADAAEVPA